MTESLPRRPRPSACSSATARWARCSTRKGIFLNAAFDELNLTQPDLVAEVHQAYVRAGADVIETNTFGANRVKLAAFGLADKVHAINIAGRADRAPGGARRRRRSPAPSGRSGIRIEPWGKTGVDEAEACSASRRAALAEGGVDLFVLETFRDLNEIGAAIRAVRASATLPIVAQMTTEEDGNSLDGTPPETFAPELEASAPTCVGVNCSVGPAPMLETIERMAARRQAPLSAQPNAGRPRDIEGRNIYLCSPEYMASYARRFVAARRAAGRRLLRHDARAHPADRASRCRRAGAAAAPPRAAAAGPVTRGAGRAAGAARARSRGWRNALARGRSSLGVELDAAAAGIERDDVVDAGPRRCASAASTSCSVPTGREPARG